MNRLRAASHATGQRLLRLTSAQGDGNRQSFTASYREHRPGRIAKFFSWDVWNQWLRQRFSTRTYVAISAIGIVLLAPFVFLASAVGAIAVVAALTVAGLIVGSLKLLGLLLVVVAELPAHCSGLRAFFFGGPAAYLRRYREVALFARSEQGVNE